jgi:polyvinyl alcohol dehydrogenase (cytochrome)
MRHLNRNSRESAQAFASLAGLVGVLTASGLAGAAGPVATSGAGEPEALYQAHCAQCHDGGVARAPHRVSFEMLGAKAIYTALTEGAMKAQGGVLSDEERIALAEHLSGQALGAVPEVAVQRCEGSPASAGAFPEPALAGWGLTLENTRFVQAADAGLSREDVPELELKWAFAYPGATRARSQPTVVGDTVYVGSQSGEVYALDLEQGCARWIFPAEAEVRSAVTVTREGGSPAAYFGDFAGNVYRVDARTGELQWRTSLDDHPALTITGSPRYFDGRLFVPMSSTEWASAADPGYACCTFRGGVAALSAQTGERLWTTHSIPETPAPSGKKNALGVSLLAPSGAPVWNSPTIDARRGLLYVGTGESYTSPAHRNSDSVLAMDLETGELRWSYQALAGDAWNMACNLAEGQRANCPEEDGPDLDFGAPPVLWRGPDGRELLLAGQKSGMVHALDPAQDGKLVWRRRVGRGGFAGGVHWGMATDGDRLFVPNADTDFIGKWKGERKPGLFALDPASGETLWFTPAGDHCAQADKPACDPGLSAAVTAIPGVVFAGGFDGMLKAYDAGSGDVLWSFNTNDDFPAIAGGVARGGSIESDGPVVYDGHLLVNSGYLFGGRMAGNALLVFSVGGD